MGTERGPRPQNSTNKLAATVAVPVAHRDWLYHNPYAWLVAFWRPGPSHDPRIDSNT